MGIYGSEDRTKEARTKCPNMISAESKCHERTCLTLYLGEGE